jgi:dihydrolipoamide dehydrogenase
MVIGTFETDADVVVIGAGPGGYVAAMRAADLGREVLLIEEREAPGGVCLIEGCIPSKALIHAVELIDQAKEAEKVGLSFGPAKLDLDKLRSWTQGVVSGLTGGVRTLLDKREVSVLHGRAQFTAPNKLNVSGGESTTVKFKHCIIATGSRPRPLPGADGLPVWTSKEALALPNIPKRLLVIGGGYIGLELGLVYAGLGSAVSLVELTGGLLPGADRDLVKVVEKRAATRFASMRFETKVTKLTHDGKLFHVTLETGGKAITEAYEQVFAAVGRIPNTDNMGLDRAGITLDARGLIPTNEQCRTPAKNIFAIGDVTAGPGLAHKASREAKVAAEVIAGLPSAFDNRAIPAVVFSDPELAWAGLTETEAAATGRKVKVGKFPLTALGRAKTMGRTDGLVKVLADPESELVLGVGIVGPHASDLIAEAVLAIEVAIHPHPTLSEALMEAAEAVNHHTVHLMPPPKPKK